MQTPSTRSIKPFHVAVLFAALLVVSGTIVLRVFSRSQPLPSGRTKLNLPVEFSRYKDWTPLHTSPYAVPLDLYLRCMAPTQADWARARQKYGPHTEHYIQVYGNQVAMQAFGSKAGYFLTGAVIAKEKLAESSDSDVEGVAFMIKRGTPQFAKTGGWEFIYYPQSGDPGRTQEHCAECHGGAASTDYVFGKYPQ